jgi:hypothetical protein
MAVSWDKENCKHCSCVNWIYHGDTSDLTVPDTLGYVCCRCFGVNSFCDGLDIEDDDPSLYELGYENPF